MCLLSIFVAVFTVPNGNESSVLTKIEKISLPITHWSSNLGLAENFGNFLSLLTAAHESAVGKGDSKKSFLCP